MPYAPSGRDFHGSPVLKVGATRIGNDEEEEDTSNVYRCK
jgi:hypothetical protein